MPQLAIAAIAALVIAAGAYGAGWKHAQNSRDSEQLHIEQAAQKAGEKATEAAVTAIKGLRPQFTTINKGIEKEIRSEVRYTSPDCSHTPESWRLLDSAYQAAGGEPFSGGAVVPDAAAAAGPNTRGNDSRAD